MLTHVGCLKTGRDHAETTRTSSNHTQRPPGAILYSAREPTVHCNPHTDTRTHTHFNVNASLLWKQRSKVVVAVIVVVFLRLTPLVYSISIKRALQTRGCTVKCTLFTLCESVFCRLLDMNIRQL